MDLALEVCNVTSIFSLIHVSILVFVDLALEVEGTNDATAAATEFQSLFSWIWLSKYQVSINVPGIMPRFNPCFRGSGSRRPPGIR